MLNESFIAGLLCGAIRSMDKVEVTFDLENNYKYAAIIDMIEEQHHYTNQEEAFLYYVIPLGGNMTRLGIKGAGIKRSELVTPAVVAQSTEVPVEYPPEDENDIQPGDPLYEAK